MTDTYGNFLNRIRAQNYATARGPTTNNILLNGPNSFTCIPPPPCKDNLPAIENGKDKEKESCEEKIFKKNGKNISYTKGTTTLSKLKVDLVNDNYLPLGIVAQSYVRDYLIANSNTFPVINKPAQMITNGNLSFKLDAPDSMRYIKMYVSLQLVDPTANCANQSVFFTVYDDHHKLFNYSFFYSTANTIYYANTIQFEFYATVPANECKEYKLYATSTSKTCYISANKGVYSDTNAVAPSYITIEDVGGFVMDCK
jgi:hypothetical protein